MSGITLAELTPLPDAVRTLLESFCRSRGQCLRLWAEEEGQRVCLYPADDGTSWNSSATLRIEVAEAPELHLEIREGDHAADTGFLAVVLSELIGYEREARSAARELTERYEEINLLYFISEILGSVLSLPDAATRILTEVADVLGARRASLWVHRADDDALHLAAGVGDDGVRGPIHVEDPESATAWVFRERQPLNLERGHVIEALPRLEPRPRPREAFLSVPINYTPPDGSARTVGVITLVGRRANIRFTAGDARLLSAIASQVGAALETQRLVQESLRQERLVRELELAHDLQLKLLPDSSTFDAPPEIVARCLPADSVGGDFYQLFRLPGDRLGIMIGDVSSHGFAAALIMALTMSAAGISAQESGPPAEVMRRIRKALINELETTEMYLTLFYGVIDPVAGQLVYSNAGHPHVVRFHDDGARERLGATDPPLGMVASDAFGEGTVPWRDGDLLFLFTDGLSDAFSGGGATGESALIESVAKIRDAPLGEILDFVFRGSSAGVPGVPPDDRTALLIRG
jgi:phosphoserine phosphatase RsbU/P